VPISVGYQSGMWILEQSLGPAWTMEAKVAWTSAYAVLAGVMMEAAEPTI